MKYFSFTPEGVSSCTVTAWLQTGVIHEKTREKTYPAIIICPGGGYEFTSEREAEPVAKPFYAAGYHVFVLNYAVGDEAKDFGPLKQVAAVIAQLRENASQWKLQSEHIAVCGFSAGGHLACSLGTLYDDQDFLKAWNRSEDIRPNAMILSYPVITADEFAHQGSIEHVSGAGAGTERYEYFGLDKHVDSQTPPTFLWHTSMDDCVPVENSLKMAAALSAAKVPFELHVFPNGGHGMSVCTDEVETKDDYNGRWVEWSILWLNKIFGFVK